MFKIILSGRITKEPEIKILDKDKVCNFTIAAHNGDKKETSYIRCSVWNKSADVMEKYVKKGKQLFVLGSGVIKKYVGNDEVERDVLNVKCISVEFGSDPLHSAEDIEIVVENGIV